MEGDRSVDQIVAEGFADGIFFPQPEPVITGPATRVMSFRDVNNYKFDYSASAVFDLVPEIRSTTSFGSQYYRNRYQIACAEGAQFPAVGVTTVSRTTTSFGTCQDVEEDATHAARKGVRIDDLESVPRTCLATRCGAEQRVRLAEPVGCQQAALVNGAEARSGYRASAPANSRRSAWPRRLRSQR